MTGADARHPHTVLITGASSGIGRATAREFRARGWTVYGTARAPQAIPSCDRVDGVTYLPLDYHHPATIEAITHALPRVDVLVNNAGIGQAGAVEDVPVDAARELFETNVFGPLQLTRAYLRPMRAHRGGTIIFIGSLITQVRVPFQSSYAASKLALVGYVQSLRHELRPYGIRTVLVEPGYIRTGIGQKRPWVAPPGSPYFIRSTTVQRKVEHEHARAADPAIVARHLVRLSDRAGQLPPRTTVGPRASAVRVATRLLPGSHVERLVAWRFGLTHKPT
ncbi:SDR family oxidoreductase [Mycobacterium eburneum]|nr:SDR family oxidoreductase [Mycobacterium eburneum]TDH56732.1 SDR family oxidoreductase [Mycobacterium eburneum]